MIKADMILDSVNPYNGKRICTLVLEYPRFIHSQFMTHRVFSRNAASSRAVPTKKMIERVKNDPAMPVHWGRNQRGMQAETEVDPVVKKAAETVWLQARDHAIEATEHLLRLGIHKQVANRLLEPFMHIQVVVTATEWDNFFSLRLHDDAQPEIQKLAQAIKSEMERSIPEEREWHVPFIFDDEQHLDLETKLKLSVARAARTSYYYHDGKRSTVEQDLDLYERLYRDRHMSPFEHQAKASERWERYNNFHAWIQYRYLLENA